MEKRECGKNKTESAHRIIGRRERKKQMREKQQNVGKKRQGRKIRIQSSNEA